MKNLLMVAMVMVIGLVGCDAPSMNLQRSAARDSGDTGVTIYLDQRKVEDVDIKKQQTLLIVSEIENILNNQHVGLLTVEKLQAEVKKIVPPEYSSISNAVLNFIVDIKIPTEKIPEPVIKNIQAFLKGTKMGITEYKIEDRK